MLDKLIRDSKPYDLDLEEAPLLKNLQDGAAETSLKDILLDREHLPGSLGPLTEEIAIEGLQETTVDQGDVDTFFFELFGGSEAGEHR